MSAYASTSTIAAIAARLRGARSVAVLGHDRPDADSMGSALGVVRALRSLGVRADVLSSDAAHPVTLALAAPGEVRAVPPLPAAEEYELALVVDTGAWSQLESTAPWLRTMAGRVLGLDHHARGDEVAGERVVETGCAATVQLVVRLADEWGVTLAPAAGARHSIAEAAFAGLATDTGWFRFSNAGKDVYELAARLLSHGVDKERLIAELEENDRPARLGMIARALTSLTTHADGRVAIMRVGPDDFAATGAAQQDLGRVVNLPLSVGQVRMAVLLTEERPGITKASFRSKPPSDGQRFFDVNTLAATFGGGGHAQAAGALFRMPVADAAAKVVTALGAGA